MTLLLKFVTSFVASASLMPEPAAEVTWLQYPLING
jgi:hypothetical protein